MSNVRIPRPRSTLSTSSATTYSTSLHLYGLSRDDAEYVLDTFPIVRREDEAAFGTYRTRDMTLAYMNAQAAGDTEAAVAV